MAYSWVVVGLDTPFTEYVDKMLIDYLYAQYDIPDPDKTNTTQKGIIFKKGFYMLDRDYEITTLERDTVIDQILSPRDYWMGTFVDINIRMYRLKPNAQDIQMLNMRNEIFRIIGAYVEGSYAIPGIYDIEEQGGTPDYAFGSDKDNKSQQDWRYIERVKLRYQLRNIK